MEPIEDPQELEPKHLREIGRLDGARVLEVGCGDGRLTWRYASLARSVFGIDPDGDDLENAVFDRPRDLAHKVAFAQAMAERLPFKSGTFDVVLLAWSL